MVGQSKDWPTAAFYFHSQNGRGATKAELRIARNSTGIASESFGNKIGMAASKLMCLYTSSVTTSVIDAAEITIQWSNGRPAGKSPVATPP
jgi:hypothetical protein